MLLLSGPLVMRIPSRICRGVAPVELPGRGPGLDPAPRATCS